jgi:hypothetical protein
MMSTIFAVNWEPELRGILILIIGTAVMMGSIYLVLGTNLGARLGFMVTFTALAGWMMLMGGVWWIYGIGLKGDDAAWVQVEGRTVIQEAEALFPSEILDRALPISGDAPSLDVAEVLGRELVQQGWQQVEESAPAFGQAEASAGVFLEEEGAFSPGEFDVTAIYEIGGDAYPNFKQFDQIAFFHEPHYTLVEVAPFEQLRTEPGRAPINAEVDTSQGRQYVYMIRDLGSLREPAATIMIGSTIVFFGMAFLLHRRDRFVAENLQRKAIAAN